MGAVEGVLAVADPAADQQPVRAVAVGDGGVGGLDQGPVIPAGALGAGAGGEPLPGPGGQPPGQLDRREGAGRRGDLVALGHRQDVAQAAAGEFGPRPGVLAVHFVGGHPGRGRPGLQRAGDHLPGQRGLGRERRVLRDPGGAAPVRVAGPGPGHVQSPVDERAPGRGRIGQVDGNLGVLGPPGGTGVLPLGTRRHGALFQVARFVCHQDRAGVREMLQHVAAQVIPYPGLIPGRGRQQPLHPPRTVLSCVPGDRPAVHPGQPGQQAPHECRHPPPRLDPGEPAAHPQHQLIKFPPPAIQVYAEASGHRTIFCSPHNSGTSGGGRAMSTASEPQGHEVSLEY